MSTIFQKKIDPIRLAKVGLVIDASFKLATFPRLAEVLASTQGEAHATFTGFEDEAGQPFMRLHVKATLVVVCQRCVKPYELPVEHTLVFAPVKDEAAAMGLSEALEPMLMENGQVNLLELLEEELLLLVPPMPKHENEDCIGQTNQAYYADLKTRPTQKPFEGLDKLLKSGD
jgi:uncharacterized protein